MRISDWSSDVCSSDLDPAHVPAGIYARQALQALGLWDQVADRLAPAANVRAALALVDRGEVPAGIVYETDAAISPRVRIVDAFPDEATRSEEHTSALQSLMRSSYAVLCLKKQKQK